MPLQTPKTKAARKAAVSQTMHEWGEGKLRSGSKHGPVVKSQKQAVAIAMHEAGMSKSAKQPHPKTNPGSYDSSPHRGADKPPPGEKFRGPQPHSFDASADAMSDRERGVGMQPTVPMRHAPPNNSSGFGHTGSQRAGCLRLSGHRGAHRIGSK